MTEVLLVPMPVQGTPYYPSTRRRRSASSRSSFYVTASEPGARTMPRAQPLHTDYAARTSSSPPSSATSSPRDSHHDLSQSTSWSSTPASSLSVSTRSPGEDEDQIIFPSYDDVGYLEPSHEDDPPASPNPATTPDTITASLDGASITIIDPPRPRPPDYVVAAEDDSAVRSEPSRHVDYLSHDWREEDIWTSWRHIVSKRKTYGNSARLENASWRTWAKSKYRLRTVSPETLNWLKDCDVTWLYGPLQTHSNRFFLPRGTPGAGTLSKTNSFLAKKPILKKRSMSEIMLQKSLSSSSLVKQAAAAVEAQQSAFSSRAIGRRPSIGRATSDFVTSSFASRSGSGEATSAYPSTSSSGLQTPATVERRHIHFNDKVEQCIAVDMLRDGDEENDELYNALADHDEDDSDDDDDGVVMMKVSSRVTAKAKASHRTTPRHSFSTDNKTIAMLPSTTLNCREDDLAPDGTSVGRPNRVWNARRLSPSPSQETLRPSKPSTNFLLDEDDDDLDMSWEPSDAFTKRADGISVPRDRAHEISDQNKDALEHNGLRRTPSGMFMPYEDDEDDAVAAGLLGKVVDTVNTAKDIAHVIWNVGWRR